MPCAQPPHFRPLWGLPCSRGALCPGSPCQTRPSVTLCPQYPLEHPISHAAGGSQPPRCPSDPQPLALGTFSIESPPSLSGAEPCDKNKDKQNKEPPQPPREVPELRANPVWLMAPCGGAGRQAPAGRGGRGRRPRGRSRGFWPAASPWAEDCPTPVLLGGNPPGRPPQQNPR